MQFYRRLVSVALLVLLVSSAVAFGESVKLTFMTFGPDSLLDAYREAIEIFEAENPGVTIDFQPATGPVDLKDKALVAFAGGIGPDLIGGDDSVAYALIDADCLLEVSELVANDPEIEQVRNSLLPGLWEMSLYSGKRYTIPMSVALADWYLNIDHFESSGLALPDEDWTWDDFLSLARRLVVYDGDKMVRGAYAVQANALHEILPWMIQAGGLPFDDWAAPTKATFSSPEVTEAMQFLYDLRWEYGVAPKPWELTGGTITMFMLGEVSMLTHWPARVGQFAREGVSFKWTVHRAPQYRARSVIGAVDGVKIGAQTKHPEVAWAFLKFLVRPDIQRILAPNFQIPAVHEVAASDDWLNNPIPGVNKLAFLKDAEFVFNRVQDPAVASDIDRIFLEEWNLCFEQDKTPVSTMISNLDARINALLAGE